MLIGAAVVILASLYYLVIDDTFFGLLASKEDDTSRPLVGQIVRFENDTRHKTKSSFAWSKAKPAQQVRLGDSVFTGAASNSLVELTQGGSLEMSSNTLIVFDDLKGLKVPNLKMGNFKLSVNGTMKVGIEDQVTTVKGNGTEVEIVVEEKKKPVIRVTKGEPQVETQVAEVIRRDSPPQPLLNIQPPEVVQVPPPPPEPAPEQVVQAPLPPPETILQPKTGIQSYLYTDQMYDFYEKKNDSELVRRRERRKFVGFPVTIQWQSTGPIENIYGQISETATFDSSVQYFQSKDAFGQVLNPVYLGTNYWRISKDGQNWSSPEFFVIESQGLELPPPQVKLSKSLLTVLGDNVQVKITLSADTSLQGFLIESSMESEFPASKTKVKWTTVKEHTFTFRRTGTYYIRARGINNKTEITNYGPVAKLEVIRPEKISAPLLTQNQIKVFEEENVKLGWAADEEAKGFQIELRNQRGELVAKESVKGSEWTWKAGRAGPYSAQVFAFDRFGRKSDKASEATLQVVPKPIVKKLPEKKPAPERQVASVESQSVEKIDPATATYLNRAFKSNRVELLGAGFTMYSSEQVTQQVEQPFALTLGFRWQAWFGDHGAEASLRSKVMGVNTSASQASPLQAEVRYNHRWAMNWNWFSNYKLSYLGFILGYEMYRNQSSNVFTSKYDLFKTGLSLAFPFASRWDTGGDLLYGFSADNSTKYEISGYFNYYFSSDFSAGLGYRLHLFEAGSASSAPPGGLPYREGYGEGYSSLRWHF